MEKRKLRRVALWKILAPVVILAYLFIQSGKIAEFIYTVDVSLRDHRSIIKDEGALANLERLALVTFVAGSEIELGKFLGGYEASSMEDEAFVGYLASEYAVQLHNSLIHDPDIELMSAIEMQANDDYASLIGQYPLLIEERHGRIFWLTESYPLLNALPTMLACIPKEETSVYSMLADDLAVDGILWVRCDYYLDVKKPGGIFSRQPGKWIGEVLTTVVIFGADGSPIWEGRFFVRSPSTMAGEEEDWIDISGDTEIIGPDAIEALLLSAIERSVDVVSQELSSILR